MTPDPPREDLRDPFDWRSAAARVGPLAGASASAVENDDVALALRLLSCKVRDREQLAGSGGEARGLA